MSFIYIDIPGEPLFRSTGVVMRDSSIDKQEGFLIRHAKLLVGFYLPYVPLGSMQFEAVN